MGAQRRQEHRLEDEPAQRELSRAEGKMNNIKEAVHRLTLAVTAVRPVGAAKHCTDSMKSPSSSMTFAVIQQMHTFAITANAGSELSEQHIERGLSLPVHQRSCNQYPSRCSACTIQLSSTA